MIVRSHTIYPLLRAKSDKPLRDIHIATRGPQWTQPPRSRAIEGLGRDRHAGAILPQF
jgi:hypothetical protein